MKVIRTLLLSKVLSPRTDSEKNAYKILGGLQVKEFEGKRVNVALSVVNEPILY